MLGSGVFRKSDNAVFCASFFHLIFVLNIVVISDEAEFVGGFRADVNYNRLFVLEIDIDCRDVFVACVLTLNGVFEVDDVRRFGQISAVFHKRIGVVDPRFAVYATQSGGYYRENRAECEYRKRNVGKSKIVLKRLFAIVDGGLFLFFRLVGVFPTHFFVVELVIFAVCGD